MIAFFNRLRLFSGLTPDARRDILVGTVLFFAAVLLRVPNFMTVPAITDEFKEVGWAIRIIEKNQFPLVAIDPYDGPLFAYLLSFAFRLFGYNMYLPRLFVLVVGSLTVVATYLLAKELARGDRRVGFVAALLLAVNSHHILFNSHVAWSHDTTPFFVTLAVFAYVHATRTNRRTWLIAAGVLFGLALQTHPSALALAPAFIVDLLLARTTRRWLRSLVPYMALFAALVVYSPVLYYNLKTGLGSLAAANDATYAFESYPTPAKSLQNLVPTLVTIGRVALGSFGSTRVDALWNDPALSSYLILTGVALIWLARHGENFPLITVLTSAIFLAIFNRFHALPDSGRYFQPLNPLIFAAWAQAGIRIWDWASQLVSTRARTLVIRAVLLISLLMLDAASLTNLGGYYAEAYSSGRNNAGILAIVQTIRAHRDEPIFVDYELAKLRTGRGGNIGDGLIYLLQLDGRKRILVSIANADSVGGLRNLLRTKEHAYLVSFTNAPDALGPEFPLQPLIVTRFPCRNCPVSTAFALYEWWGMAEAESGQCSPDAIALEAEGRPLTNTAAVWIQDNFLVTLHSLGKSHNSRD